MGDGEQERAVALANRVIDLLALSGETLGTQILALTIVTAAGGKRIGLTPEMLKRAMETFLNGTAGEALSAGVVVFRNPGDGA